MPAPTPSRAAAAMLLGYGLDCVAGDPARLHPVAGFGRLAAWTERALYAPTRGRGVVVAALLLGASVVTARLLVAVAGPFAAGVLVTWTALGGRSLRQEARAIGGLLDAGDLDGARHRLRSLCGRDASKLDAEGISRACIESLAENSSDAVVGALVWGAVAGPVGAAAYRSANTLDAMFGHRSERYREFGWASARADDLLNWPCARFTAALTAGLAPLVSRSPRAVLHTVARDAPAHPSPNAGVAEAAFAAALGLRLGGPVSYRGRHELRPLLGDGRAPVPGDIESAARLSAAVCGLAALVCSAVAGARG